MRSLNCLSEKTDSSSSCDCVLQVDGLAPIRSVLGAAFHPTPKPVAIANRFDAIADEAATPVMEVPLAAFVKESKQSRQIKSHKRKFNDCPAERRCKPEFPSLPGSDEAELESSKGNV